MKWIVCLLALGACCGPQETQVMAQRATYNAIAPEYRTYVLEDEAMTTEARDRRLLTLETWDLRIKAQEEALAK